MRFIIMTITLYHYRTNHGSEIDLILQKNAHPPSVAIEIKSSEAPSSRDVRHLSSRRRDQAGLCHGRLTTDEK